MDRVTVIAGLSDDRSQLYLAMHRGEAPDASVLLGAPEVDAFIAKLSDLRAHLDDPVPHTIDPGSALNAVENPSFSLSDQGGAGIAMAFRHPGLRWVTFLFPRARAQLLAREILDVLGVSR